MNRLFNVADTFSQQRQLYRVRSVNTLGSKLMIGQRVDTQHLISQDIHADRRVRPMGPRRICSWTRCQPQGQGRPWEPKLKPQLKPQGLFVFDFRFRHLHSAISCVNREKMDFRLRLQIEAQMNSSNSQHTMIQADAQRLDNALRLSHALASIPLRRSTSQR